jgi:16S rRNA (cytosine1402-N4)-methyltransferase
VDATAGDGGHTALLAAQGVQVLAIDRDTEALERARHRLSATSVTWVAGRFGDPAVLERVRAFHPDFALLDLGVSSLQLNADERGFSFRPHVPLDMRMSGDGPCAADLLNTLSTDELAAVFRDFGDERRARRLAGEVARRREGRPFAQSDDLVNAIRAALGPRTGPAVFARLFQAVRIAVNEEFTQLRAALPALRAALVEGGRLAVISYHSGEDRIVKNLFRDWAKACVCPQGQPVCTCRGVPLGRLDPRRPVMPSAGEIAANPRARSARLRAFVTHGAP